MKWQRDEVGKANKGRGDQFHKVPLALFRMLSTINWALGYKTQFNLVFWQIRGGLLWFGSDEFSQVTGCLLTIRMLLLFN